MSDPSRYPWGKGRLVASRDATANSNTRTLTVPTGKFWKPLMLWCTYTASADVGNRNVEMVITDGTNIIYIAGVGQTVAASQVYVGVLHFTGGAGWVTSARRASAGSNGNVSLTDFPGEVVLPAGYQIKIYDSQNVAANADDIVSWLNYVEYDA